MSLYPLRYRCLLNELYMYEYELAVYDKTSLTTGQVFNRMCYQRRYHILKNQILGLPI